MTLRAVPDRALRAVDYRRVSMVGSRDEIISPEIQTAANADHAARNNWPVVATLSDIDRSGRNFTRTGIREAIEGVEQGRWQVVVVYRYDRFGRNLRDSLINIARVEEAGGQVVSATEPFDAATAVGKYGRANLLAVAELQSDLIGEGWKAAHAHRVGRGLPHTMRERFGYRIVNGGFEPDPETGPQLVECYRRYNAGQTPRQIADWLNSVGARTTRGGRWTANTLRPLLAAGFAAGFLRSHGQLVEGAHEALIDRRTWNAYLKRREAASAEPPQSRGGVRPLTGLVICQSCGKPMRWWAGNVKGQRYEAYRCLAAWGGCGRNYIGYPRALDAVREVLAEVSDELDAATLKARQGETRAAAKSERAIVGGKVVEIQRAIRRLTDSHARGITPEAAYVEVLADLTAEQDGLERRLRQLSEQPPRRPLARKILRDFDRLLADDPGGMKPVLHSLVLGVVVWPGRNPSVKAWGIPRWVLYSE